MRIVVVSPFPAERNALVGLLRSDGHQIAAVATPEEGLHLATTSALDAIIIDAQVAELDGRWRGLAARVILMCPRGGGCDTTTATFLTKPIELAQLQRCLEREALVA